MATAKTERIKIQTARMLEIYALLRRELESHSGLKLSPQAQNQLHQAIDSIAANMQLLQHHVTLPEEGNSPLDENSSRQLDEIVNAVLKWQMANEEGE